MYPSVRRSPYFPRTEAAGATEYIVYNHMYMPMAYGRDPRQDYQALAERVTLWDVGAERQTQLQGRDARVLADRLTTRRISDLDVGGCRYTVCCDERGEIICDPVLLIPRDDTVWLSHGTVDLTLWAKGLAHGWGLDVEVSEPDVAPLQVQGPRAADVVRSLAGPAIDDLRPFRCMDTRLAEQPAVVSRTGWSGGPGFEIFPLGSERALAIWDALVAAGVPHGMLITGPNIAKALESGITDTSYATNQHLNPMELWQDYLVDLDKGPFIGREALAEVARTGVQRRTVGLLGPRERVPRLEAPWPIAVDGTAAGSTRWVTFSYALERTIAIGVVQAALSARGARVTVVSPGGEVEMEIADLPFV
jgi:glycine cleavage system aminomethyltransferase T